MYMMYVLQKRREGWIVTGSCEIELQESSKLMVGDWGIPRVKWLQLHNLI
ncbi:hypothetical protein Hanom_Chr01g00063931 [Helianthus anomalus]